MKLRNFSFLLSFPSIIAATWSTLYSSNSSLAYIYTQDGSLYTFPTNSSSFTTAQAESMFTKISSPPLNSTLVIDQNSDDLIAVYGSSGCSTSPINIATYDNKQNQWTKINSSPDNWYLEMPTVWSQPKSSVIYIFGGYCEDTNVISDTLYAYNTSSGQFFTPQNQNSPIELYAAGVTAVTPSTFLLIGGRAKNGWISMNQVAVWEYSSWTFKSTANSNNVDSRTNPLLIPVWTNNQQDSADSVIILGGEVDGRAAEPFVVNLNLGDEWTWSNSSLESILDPSTIDGALAIDNALLTLSEKSNNKVAVNIFDMNSGKILSNANGFPTSTPVSVSIPTHTVTVATKETITPPTTTTTTTSTSSSQNISKGGIAALSTVLPISALCLLGAIGGIFIARKRKRNKDHIRTLHLSPAPSVGNFIDVPMNRNQHSWYSAGGDTASINSWNEKRVMYEENVQRHSTLSQSPTREQISSPPPLSPKKSNRSAKYNDEDDIFQGRDVQILVSSLRRTPLRVVNPDEETDNSSSLSRAASTIKPPAPPLPPPPPPPPPPPSRPLPTFTDNFISRSSSVQEGGRQNHEQIHVHKRNLSNISSTSIDSSYALTTSQRSTSGTTNRRIASNHTT